MRLPDGKPPSCDGPRFVGCDVHKRQITFCILDAQGNVLQRGRLATTREAITAFARTQLRPTDHVALEATTNTWAVVELIEPHVARVVVSNPLTTKAIAAAKIKTDKIDAHVLADLLRCNYLPEVWQPDAATRELRRLTSRRAGLCADRTAIKNRLHATLAVRLIVPPHRDLFSTAGLAWLRHASELDEETRGTLDSNLRLLDTLQAEMDMLDLTLARLGYSEERVRLLMTLPGVNMPVALALLAAWGETGRFPDAEHAVSYLGVVPITRQSDQHCYHGRITKHGNHYARWMLGQAAQHVDTHPGPLGAFFRRLARKKNRNVAVVATARKLAVVAWHMLQSHEPYRYAIPLSTETKLARLRVKATGQRRQSNRIKGIANVSKSPDGGRTRTVKPLARLYEVEGLPPLPPRKPGEERMLQELGVSDFVASLSQPQILLRKRKPDPGPQETAIRTATAGGDDAAKDRGNTQGP